MSRKILVPPRQAIPKFLARNVEVSELDVGPEGNSAPSKIVPLGARPKTILQHHIQPELQRAGCDVPLHVFNWRAMGIQLGFGDVHSV